MRRRSGTDAASHLVRAVRADRSAPRGRRPRDLGAEPEDGATLRARGLRMLAMNAFRALVPALGLALGAGQDAEVFLDRLRTLADDSPDWPARTADAIDVWRDSLERVAVKSRRRFAAAFRAPSRARWKRVAAGLRHPSGPEAAETAESTGATGEAGKE